jgi:hypothetical protein
MRGLRKERGAEDRDTLHAAGQTIRPRCREMGDQGLSMPIYCCFCRSCRAFWASFRTTSLDEFLDSSP